MTQAKTPYQIIEEEVTAAAQVDAMSSIFVFNIYPKKMMADKIKYIIKQLKSLPAEALLAEPIGRYYIQTNALKEMFGARRNFTLLHLALFSKCDNRTIKDLLEMGADPMIYGAEVTPVGYAAYTNDLSKLRLFKRFGATFDLLLTHEHTTIPAMIDSTLLMRCLTRKVLDVDVDKKLKVLQFLLKHTTNPWKKNANGGDLLTVVSQECPHKKIIDWVGQEKAKYEGGRLRAIARQKSLASPRKKMRI